LGGFQLSAKSTGGSGYGSDVWDLDREERRREEGRHEELTPGRTQPQKG